ncbi:hypothetical protein DFJ73DRAFT_763489 [Zopfochytrium polystomum]|nr:hypothetical protein DFJ73DRAFT_763489 [Zopfochytrium polystomum]
MAYEEKKNTENWNRISQCRPERTDRERRQREATPEARKAEAPRQLQEALIPAVFTAEIDYMVLSKGKKGQTRDPAVPSGGGRAAVAAAHEHPRRARRGDVQARSSLGHLQNERTCSTSSSPLNGLTWLEADSANFRAQS